MILLSVGAARSVLIEQPVTRRVISKDSLRDGNIDVMNGLS